MLTPDATCIRPCQATTNTNRAADGAALINYHPIHHATDFPDDTPNDANTGTHFVLQSRTSCVETDMQIFDQC